MAGSIIEFLQQHHLSPELIVFIISMVPIVELRGGIIAASFFNIPIAKAYFICVAGNMAPIPIILLFIKEIFAVLKKFRWSAHIVNKLEVSAIKKSDKVRRNQLLGLFAFVAIPLPGTGGWTGALIASLLNVSVKKSFFTLLFGVMAAGLIMIVVSYFIPGLFGF